MGCPNEHNQTILVVPQSGWDGRTQEQVRWWLEKNLKRHVRDPNLRVTITDESPDWFLVEGHYVIGPTGELERG
jgi:hypothetical protein